MSERGVFAVDRGIWDHPVLQSRDPFSKREAWLWLLSAATWRAKAVFVDGKRVELKRGQLAHSIRFMADQWGWPKSNVTRFLHTLKTETMIGTDSGTGITVITISKYEEYQKVSLPRGTHNETPTGTKVGHERDKEEIREYREEEDDAPAAPARGPNLISPEANEIADELAEIAGHPRDPKSQPPGWYGAAARVQAWLSEGWGREIILIGARAAMARKRDGPPRSVNYFEGAIAQAVADQARPVPIASPQQPRTNHAAPVENSFASTLARLGTAAASLRASAGSGSGEDAPRMLSDGRGERS